MGHARHAGNREPRHHPRACLRAGPVRDPDEEARLCRADAFGLTLFALFEPTIANIYIGLAERARDLAIERVEKRNSVADMTHSMTYHPEVEHTIADVMIV
jgi:hypothetical protein